LYPCGLVANSFFNDSFTATQNGIPLTWDETNIAWSSDVNVKFVEQFPGQVYIPASAQLTRFGPNGELPFLNNEHFIVWMRTAGLPTFKKLYAQINTQLNTGDNITFTITEMFQVSSFSGTKSLVLSTASWIGGQNTFLGLAYIIVGGVSLLLAIVFWIKECVSPRTLGDMKYFNWPGKGPSPTRE